MLYEFTQCLHISESSMYLPVTPVKSKHRRSLNLLDVPHPQHGPHVKQNKVWVLCWNDVGHKHSHFHFLLIK